MKEPISIMKSDGPNGRIVKDFVWGPVVEIHHIGLYSIVEYHPQIFEEGRGKGYDMECTTFHPYINGRDTCHSFESLDDALFGAVFYKVLGGNERLSSYVKIILDAERNAS